MAVRCTDRTGSKPIVLDGTCLCIGGCVCRMSPRSSVSTVLASHARMPGSISARSDIAVPLPAPQCEPRRTLSRLPRRRSEFQFGSLALVGMDDEEDASAAKLSSPRPQSVSQQPSTRDEAETSTIASSDRLSDSASFTLEVQRVEVPTAGRWALEEETFHW
eukprot:TRINITY_DN93694_c0_g1_i1.p1 TRINITY_DN93694_c0_g1~~TRINITY_DN93694_c0_g1_i1.p1  ORF type:complete len:162 (-),score=5.11 TRINITY_DN93694_c0_g1_i1:352-837(-)